MVSLLSRRLALCRPPFTLQTLTSEMQMKEVVLWCCVSLSTDSALLMTVENALIGRDTKNDDVAG